MRAQLPITRRDFLDGVALAIGAGAVDRMLRQFMAPAFAAGRAPQDEPGYYPPALTGLRGNHVGSFEAAHRLRDREFWPQAGKITDTGETYDLVVVGGGISGLAAAHFYRAAQEAPASSFSTIMTISAATPNATNLRSAAAWR